MTLALTSVLPLTTFANGGYEATLRGTFATDELYRVHVGINGDTTDAVAYRGPNLGSVGPPLTTGLLRFYTPILNPGGPYSITVKNIDTLEEVTIAGGITYEQRQFYTSVFDLRSVMPPNYVAGPREMARLPTLGV